MNCTKTTLRHNFIQRFSGETVHNNHLTSFNHPLSYHAIHCGYNEHRFTGVQALLDNQLHFNMIISVKSTRMCHLVTAR